MTACVSELWSITVSCSTSTWVSVPLISTLGRNDAVLWPVEVGAMIQVLGLGPQSRPALRPLCFQDRRPSCLRA